MNKLLSIIIPVYNTKPEFIKECIESISLPKIDFEIILVNDGSTDEDTKKFINSLDVNSDFIIVHKENEGASGARNAGIEIAQGKYIFPIDSDDRLFPENLLQALTILENNEDFDIVYGDFQNFGDKTTYNKSGVFSRMKLAISGDFVSACILYRKKVWEGLNGYDITYKTNEDWDFSSRAATNGFNFFYLPKPLFEYRRIFNGLSLSQSDYKNYSKNRIRIIESAPRSFFTKENINDYVITSYKREKKLFLKTFLIIFFPNIYKLLSKKGYFKNDIIVD